MTALVTSGDLAGDAGDRTRLAEVAHLIADLLPAPLQSELRAVEELADKDLDAARAHWSVVSRCVHDWIASSFAHRA